MVKKGTLAILGIAALGIYFLSKRSNAASLPQENYGASFETSDISGYPLYIQKQMAYAQLRHQIAPIEDVPGEPQTWEDLPEGSARWEYWEAQMRRYLQDPSIAAKYDEARLIQEATLQGHPDVTGVVSDLLTIPANNPITWSVAAIDWEQQTESYIKKSELLGIPFNPADWGLPTL